MSSAAWVSGITPGRVAGTAAARLTRRLGHLPAGIRAGIKLAGLAGLSSPPGEDDVVQGAEPPDEAGLLPGRQRDLVFHGAGPAADRGAARVVQHRGHCRVTGADQGGEAADA